MTASLIEQDNRLRRSILPMFLPLMRIQLVKLEKLLAPALSTVTWPSQNNDGYFPETADIMKGAIAFEKLEGPLNTLKMALASKLSSLTWMVKIYVIYKSTKMCLSSLLLAQYYLFLIDLFNVS